MLLCIYAGIEEGNAAENVLAWPSLARPSIEYGCSLQKILDSSLNSQDFEVQEYSLQSDTLTLCSSLSLKMIALGRTLITEHLFTHGLLSKLMLGTFAGAS